MSVKQGGETEGLLLALRDVAQAQGGVGALADRSGLNREHLYRVLSSRSKPKIDNLMAIISALGSFGSGWISPSYKVPKFQLRARRGGASASVSNVPAGRLGEIPGEVVFNLKKEKYGF